MFKNIERLHRNTGNAEQPGFRKHKVPGRSRAISSVLVNVLYSALPLGFL